VRYGTRAYGEKVRRRYSLAWQYQRQSRLWGMLAAIVAVHLWGGFTGLFVLALLASLEALLSMVASAVMALFKVEPAGATGGK
jgi:hypothetical protein